MIKYDIVQTSLFKKEVKLMKKRGKDLDKLGVIIDCLATGENIPWTYRDHQLINNSRFINCRELHIEPDWLLVYQIKRNELILLLIETGTHSDLFNK